MFDESPLRWNAEGLRAPDALRHRAKSGFARHMPPRLQRQRHSARGTRRFVGWPQRHAPSFDWIDEVAARFHAGPRISQMVRFPRPRRGYILYEQGLCIDHGTNTAVKALIVKMREVRAGERTRAGTDGNGPRRLARKANSQCMPLHYPWKERGK